MALLSDILTDLQIEQLACVANVAGIRKIVEPLSIEDAMTYIIKLDDWTGFSVCLDNRESKVEWPESFQYWKWDQSMK